MSSINCLEGFLFRNDANRSSLLSIRSETKREQFSRSQSIKEKLEILKKGSMLYKIRDKGIRGITFYKRKYWLDMDNLQLRFKSHKEESKMYNCSISQEDSFYNLKDISEVRTEYNTDIFNKIKTKSSSSKYRDIIEHRYVFSLIFVPDSNMHELDLIADDEITRTIWVDAISHLILTLKSLTYQKEYELFLKSAFRKADENSSGYLNFDEVKDMCKQLNIKLEKEEMTRLFNLANTDKGNLNRKDKGQVLNVDEFITFYFKLMARPDIDDIFNTYSNKDRMTVNNLAEFFNNVQQFALGEEECKGIIMGHEVSEDKTSFSREGFRQFLMFSELQNVMDPVEKTQVRDDMTQPLSHYWIASSHNTYLTGNQLTGDSSIDGYINALKLGCRCVELDCWDGSDGEPIIYHGYTLTTKILFKDVIEACKKYGFNKSSYPLILSIENHCSIDQQKTMAKHLKSILGDMLYTGEPDETLSHLPSPFELNNKVLIKAKRLQADAADDEDEKDDERDDAKKKKAKVAKELSDLVNYIHAVHFPGFHVKDAKYYHMSSFGESKTDGILDDPLEARKFVIYNTKQISRIYPGAKRQDSSNIKPFPAWAAGCQIVALNYQTDDQQNMWNRSWFSGNGGCGYVLKPEFLRRPEMHYNPTKLNGLNKSIFPSLTLDIEIVSGQHIPKPKGAEEGEVIDPYIEIRIHGHNDDHKDENSVETNYVKNNGFNPVWREVFKFNIIVPDLAMLELKVKDHSRSKADQHLGSFAIPIRYLQEGYRKATLVDYTGKELTPAAIFLKINKKFEN